jgi:hypothetical protein
MRVSVAQRRNGIVAECRQLSNDVGYFNGLHPDAAIQLVLNFTKDVEELDQPRAERAEKAILLSANGRQPQSAPRRPAAPASISSPAPSHPSAHA